jgi:hypothetical protein
VEALKYFGIFSKKSASQRNKSHPTAGHQLLQIFRLVMQVINLQVVSLDVAGSAFIA